MCDAPASEFPGGVCFPNLPCTTAEVSVVLLSQHCMNPFAFVCYGEVKVEVRGSHRRQWQAFR